MEVKVPDIGDFDEVPVIEIHVAAGDTVAKEDPLITLESDKATMDVPSPEAGTVTEVLVKVDDKVKEGSPILTLETEESGEGAQASETEERPSSPSPSAAASPPDSDKVPSDAPQPPTPDEAAGSSGGASRADGDGSPPEPVELPDADHQCDVLVVGSGPGGYAAAFRAADLGLSVVLAERFETLGGVCLNVGCIPSKALLHAARIIAETEEAGDFGLSFAKPEIDLDRLRAWKQEVVGKLTGGLEGLVKRRKVEVVTGTAKFTGEHTAEVDGTSVAFQNCIIAAGSRSVELPGIPMDDDRVMDSTGALELADIPEKLLVVGGGIIGLEMATAYEALGSVVTIVELTDQLIPGCDPDLVKPLHERIAKRGEVLLSTKVTAVEPGDDGLKATFEGDGAPEPTNFDRVLVAVGRRANGDLLEIAEAGVKVDERGEIAVDEQRRTNVPHIYAIGDIAGGPMLAHKATHEGKTAAEVIAGMNVAFAPRAIPSVAYTDPEVAWTGLTETEAKENGTEYEVAKFPWQASGRALALGRAEGFTKLLVDASTRAILGAGIVGVNAGDLIAEATLAIEMGADAEDVGLTIHPHPTLSESIAFAAELAEGTITDLYAPKKRS